MYKERERIRIYLCTLNERFISHQTLTKQKMNSQQNLIWKRFIIKQAFVLFLLYVDQKVLLKVVNV